MSSRIARSQSNSNSNSSSSSSNNNNNNNSGNSSTPGETVQEGSVNNSGNISPLPTTSPMIVGNNINNNIINESQGIENLNIQQMMMQMMQTMHQHIVKLEEKHIEEMKETRLYQEKQLAAQQQISQQQIDQHKSSANNSLARVSAGLPPIFYGKYNDIEIHKWIISIEQWFISAEIIDDKEKLKIAIPYLKDSAQSWWEGEKSSGKAITYIKWEDFSDAIKKQFFPQDVTRWAKLQLKELTSRINMNIITYSQRYGELDKLAGNREMEDRMIDFECGLPEEYRIKCAEKKYINLADTMNAMVTIYNARLLTKSQNKTTTIHKMEQEEVESKTAKDNDKMEDIQPVKTELNPELISLLHTMFSQQFSGRGGFNSNYKGNNFRGGNNNRGGSSNYRGGYRGRERYQGSRPEGSTNNNHYNRSRSPSVERIPGLTKEMVTDRISKQVCLKCAEKGHYARECTNQIKLN